MGGSRRARRSNLARAEQAVTARADESSVVAPPTRLRWVRPAVAAACAGVLATMAWVHGSVLVKIAAQKPLWGDEWESIRTSLRPASYLRFLLRGPPNQGSPSPLDYALLKALDAIRHQVGYFGLHPMSYYRLVAISAVTLAAVAVGMILFRRWSGRDLASNAVSAVLVLLAVLAFWLDGQIVYFSMEMRPYALWVGLSFIAYVATFVPASRWWLAAAWAAVAATATAALFQISCVAAALCAVELLEGRTLRETARRYAPPLGIGLAIAGYYALFAGKWNYWGPEWGTWGTFYEFWSASAPVAVLSGAGVVVALLRRETRRFAVPSLAMLLLWLASPVIYVLTRHRGFFFTPRQYIYFGLALPLFLLTVAHCLPAWFQGRSWRPAALVAAAACAAVLTHRFVREKAASLWDLGQTPRLATFPHDPSRLLDRALRAGHLPAGFCAVDRGDPNGGAMLNLEYVAEWLPTRHPLPVRAGEFVFITTHGDNARVVGIGGDGAGVCTGFRLARVPTAPVR